MNTRGVSKLLITYHSSKFKMAGTVNLTSPANVGSILTNMPRSKKKYLSSKSENLHGERMKKSKPLRTRSKTLFQ